MVRTGGTRAGKAVDFKLPLVVLIEGRRLLKTQMGDINANWILFYQVACGVIQIVKVNE